MYLTHAVSIFKSFKELNFTGWNVLRPQKVYEHLPQESLKTNNPPLKRCGERKGDFIPHIQMVVITDPCLAKWHNLRHRDH